MHYFLIAGEASGDLHASALMGRLKEHDRDARFTFLGGDLMAAEAGCPPLIHYRDMAFMGFSEVIRHIPEICSNMKRTRKALRQGAPSCLVLIDYPGFNLKMARTAFRLGIPVYYYISPKVWAWKEYRVKTIKRLVRQMFVIFPFEVDFYRRHGYEVSYVGNPSVEEVGRKIGAAPSRGEFLSRNRLRDRPLVALMPGSRRGEVKNNLPVMAAAMMQFPQYYGVVAGAPGLDPDFYRQFTSMPVLHGQTFDLLAHSHAAIVTSGTATLETAIAGVPQVVTYRSNGSRLAYNLMKGILKVRYVSLPNLIADSEIIPELLLHRCTPDMIASALAEILPESPARSAQTEGYAMMRGKLGSRDTADETARMIISDLSR